MLNSGQLTERGNMSSLPTPNGVSGTAYSLSSISAELHLFGPIVAISAALDDMNVSSGELLCSLENTLTRETSQNHSRLLKGEKELHDLIRVL
ncbi:hypothetical protein KEM48_010037 [Puccinia striiformis f. sp. tritici PST-130]|nr:hypothetical protein KEM48_010037 [Puccinia striiformis f. sp. tritici PST-130]